MRNNDTAAEEKLWRALRRLPIDGSHFRRQVPIGNFIADFACLSARLILEVDGSRHGTPTGLSADAERTAWLESKGFKVIRFWNSEIVENIDGVLDAVYAALYGSMTAEPHSFKPSPSTPPRRATRADPPPPGEGGRRPSRKRSTHHA
jgi:very-short-patch-repair endonuclease